jgi:hypothetical protein
MHHDERHSPAPRREQSLVEFDAVEVERDTRCTEACIGGFESA